MKHLYRTAAALLAAAVLMTALLTGCGQSGPTEKDAEKYVKAVLDLMCTGDYDHSVSFSDIEEGSEQKSRDEMIDSIVASVSEDSGLSEDQSTQFRDFISRAFSACRYSVKGVQETEDGGFDVTVSIEPLMVFNGVQTALKEEVAKMTEDTDSAITMTEEEQSAMLTDALFRVLDQNLENPQYAPAEEVVVHYGVLNNTDGLYGIDEDAGNLLGQKLFSAEGM